MQASVLGAQGGAPAGSRARGSGVGLPGHTRAQGRAPRSQGPRVPQRGRKIWGLSDSAGPSVGPWAAPVPGAVGPWARADPASGGGMRFGTVSHRSGSFLWARWLQRAARWQRRTLGRSVPTSILSSAHGRQLAIKLARCVGQGLTAQACGKVHTRSRVGRLGHWDSLSAPRLPQATTETAAPLAAPCYSVVEHEGGREARGREGERLGRCLIALSSGQGHVSQWVTRALDSV